MKISVPRPKPFLVEVLLNDGETWSPIMSFGSLQVAKENASYRGEFGQTARVKYKGEVVYNDNTQTSTECLIGRAVGVVL